MLALKNLNESVGLGLPKSHVTRIYSHQFMLVKTLLGVSEKLRLTQIVWILCKTKARFCFNEIVTQIMLNLLITFNSIISFVQYTVYSI